MTSLPNTITKLFAPGPVQVPQFLRDQLSIPNDTHRSQEYQALHKSVRSQAQKLLHTTNDIFIFGSSGSGVMESCVLNLVRRRKDQPFVPNCIIFSCGNFGERWIDMAKCSDRPCDTVEIRRLSLLPHG